MKVVLVDFAIASPFNGNFKDALGFLSFQSFFEQLDERFLRQGTAGFALQPLPDTRCETAKACKPLRALQGR